MMSNLCDFVACYDLSRGNFDKTGTAEDVPLALRTLKGRFVGSIPRAEGYSSRRGSVSEFTFDNDSPNTRDSRFEIMPVESIREKCPNCINLSLSNPINACQKCSELIQKFPHGVLAEINRNDFPDHLASVDTETSPRDLNGNNTTDNRIRSQNVGSRPFSCLQLVYPNGIQLFDADRAISYLKAFDIDTEELNSTIHSTSTCRTDSSFDLSPGIKILPHNIRESCSKFPFSIHSFVLTANDHNATQSYGHVLTRWHRITDPRKISVLRLQLAAHTMFKNQQPGSLARTQSSLSEDSTQSSLPIDSTDLSFDSKRILEALISYTNDHSHSASSLEIANLCFEPSSLVIVTPRPLFETARSLLLSLHSHIDPSQRLGMQHVALLYRSLGGAIAIPRSPSEILSPSLSLNQTDITVEDFLSGDITDVRAGPVHSSSFVHFHSSKNASYSAESRVEYIPSGFISIDFVSTSDANVSVESSAVHEYFGPLQRFLVELCTRSASMFSVPPSSTLGSNNSVSVLDIILPVWCPTDSCRDSALHQCFPIVPLPASGWIPFEIPQLPWQCSKCGNSSSGLTRAEVTSLTENALVYLESRSYWHKEWDAAVSSIRNTYDSDDDASGIDRVLLQQSVHSLNQLLNRMSSLPLEPRVPPSSVLEKLRSSDTRICYRCIKCISDHDDVKDGNMPSASTELAHSISGEKFRLYDIVDQLLIDSDSVISVFNNRAPDATHEPNASVFSVSSLSSLSTVSSTKSPQDWRSNDNVIELNREGMKLKVSLEDFDSMSMKSLFSIVELVRNLCSQMLKSPRSIVSAPTLLNVCIQLLDICRTLCEDSASIVISLPGVCGELYSGLWMNSLKCVPGSVNTVLNSLFERNSGDHSHDSKSLILNSSYFKSSIPISPRLMSPMPLPLPPLDIDARSILCRVQPANIIAILNCLLCERSVLLVSSDQSLLSDALSFFAALLFPLRWRGIISPMLPSTFSLSDFLSAPQPILAGATPSAVRMALPLVAFGGGAGREHKSDAKNSRKSGSGLPFKVPPLVPSQEEMARLASPRACRRFNCDSYRSRARSTGSSAHVIHGVGDTVAPAPFDSVFERIFSSVAVKGAAGRRPHQQQRIGPNLRAGKYFSVTALPRFRSRFSPLFWRQFMHILGPRAAYTLSQRPGISGMSYKNKAAEHRSHSRQTESPDTFSEYLAGNRKRSSNNGIEAPYRDRSSSISSLESYSTESVTSENAFEIDGRSAFYTSISPLPQRLSAIFMSLPSQQSSSSTSSSGIRAARRWRRVGDTTFYPLPPCLPITHDWNPLSVHQQRQSPPQLAASAAQNPTHSHSHSSGVIAPSWGDSSTTSLRKSIRGHQSSTVLSRLHGKRQQLGLNGAAVSSARSSQTISESLTASLVEQDKDKDKEIDKENGELRLSDLVEEPDTVVGSGKEKVTATPAMNPTATRTLSSMVLPSFWNFSALEAHMNRSFSSSRRQKHKAKDKEKKWKKKKGRSDSITPDTSKEKRKRAETRFSISRSMLSAAKSHLGLEAAPTDVAPRQGPEASSRRRKRTTKTVKLKKKVNEIEIPVVLLEPELAVLDLDADALSPSAIRASHTLPSRLSMRLWLALVELGAASAYQWTNPPPPSVPTGTPTTTTNTATNGSSTSTNGSTISPNSHGLGYLNANFFSFSATLNSGFSDPPVASTVPIPVAASVDPDNSQGSSPSTWILPPPLPHFSPLASPAELSLAVSQWVRVALSRGLRFDNGSLVRSLLPEYLFSSNNTIWNEAASDNASTTSGNSMSASSNSANVRKRISELVLVHSDLLSHRHALSSFVVSSKEEENVSQADQGNDPQLFKVKANDQMPIYSVPMNSAFQPLPARAQRLLSLKTCDANPSSVFDYLFSHVDVDFKKLAQLLEEGSVGSAASEEGESPASASSSNSVGDIRQKKKSVFSIFSSLRPTEGVEGRSNIRNEPSPNISGNKKKKGEKSQEEKTSRILPPDSPSISSISIRICEACNKPFARAFLSRGVDREIESGGLEPIDLSEGLEGDMLSNSDAPIPTPSVAGPRPLSIDYNGESAAKIIFEGIDRPSLLAKVDTPTGKNVGVKPVSSVLGILNQVSPNTPSDIPVATPPVSPFPPVLSTSELLQNQSSSGVDQLEDTQLKFVESHSSSFETERSSSVSSEPSLPQSKEAVDAAKISGIITSISSQDVAEPVNTHSEIRLIPEYSNSANIKAPVSPRQMFCSCEHPLDSVPPSHSNSSTESLDISPQDDNSKNSVGPNNSPDIQIGRSLHLEVLSTLQKASHWIQCSDGRWAHVSQEDPFASPVYSQMLREIVQNGCNSGATSRGVNSLFGSDLAVREDAITGTGSRALSQAWRPGQSLEDAEFAEIGEFGDDPEEEDEDPVCGVHRDAHFGWSTLLAMFDSLVNSMNLKGYREEKIFRQLTLLKKKMLRCRFDQSSTTLLSPWEQWRDSLPLTSVSLMPEESASTIDTSSTVPCAANNPLYWRLHGRSAVALMGNGRVLSSRVHADMFELIVMNHFVPAPDTTTSISSGLSIVPNLLRPKSTGARAPLMGSPVPLVGPEYLRVPASDSSWRRFMRLTVLDAFGTPMIPLDHKQSHPSPSMNGGGVLMELREPQPNFVAFRQAVLNALAGILRGIPLYFSVDLANTGNNTTGGSSFDNKLGGSRNHFQDTLHSITENTTSSTNPTANNSIVLSTADGDDSDIISHSQSDGTGTLATAGVSESLYASTDDSDESEEESGSFAYSHSVDNLTDEDDEDEHSVSSTLDISIESPQLNLGDDTDLEREPANSRLPGDSSLLEPCYSDRLHLNDLEDGVVEFRSIPESDKVSKSPVFSFVGSKSNLSPLLSSVNADSHESKRDRYKEAGKSGRGRKASSVLSGTSSPPPKSLGPAAQSHAQSQGPDALSTTERYNEYLKLSNAGRIFASPFTGSIMAANTVQSTSLSASLHAPAVLQLLRASSNGGVHQSPPQAPPTDLRLSTPYDGESISDAVPLDVDDSTGTGLSLPLLSEGTVVVSPPLSSRALSFFQKDEARARRQRLHSRSLDTNDSLGNSSTHGLSLLSDHPPLMKESSRDSAKLSSTLLLLNGTESSSSAREQVLPSSTLPVLTFDKLSFLATEMPSDPSMEPLLTQMVLGTTLFELFVAELGETVLPRLLKLHAFYSDPSFNGNVFERNLGGDSTAKNEIIDRYDLLCFQKQMRFVQRSRALYSMGSLPLSSLGASDVTGNLSSSGSYSDLGKLIVREYLLRSTMYKSKRGTMVLWNLRMFELFTGLMSNRRLLNMMKLVSRRGLNDDEDEIFDEEDDDEEEVANEEDYVASDLNSKRKLITRRDVLRSYPWNAEAPSGLSIHQYLVKYFLTLRSGGQSTDPLLKLLNISLDNIYDRIVYSSSANEIAAQEKRVAALRAQMNANKAYLTMSGVQSNPGSLIDAVEQDLNRRVAFDMYNDSEREYQEGLNRLEYLRNSRKRGEFPIVPGRTTLRIPAITNQDSNLFGFGSRLSSPNSSKLSGENYVPSSIPSPYVFQIVNEVEDEAELHQYALRIGSYLSDHRCVLSLSNLLKASTSDPALVGYIASLASGAKKSEDVLTICASSSNERRQWIMRIKMMLRSHYTDFQFDEEESESTGSIAQTIRLLYLGDGMK